MYTQGHTQHVLHSSLGGMLWRLYPGLKKVCEGAAASAKLWQRPSTSASLEAISASAKSIHGKVKSILHKNRFWIWMWVLTQ